MSHTDWNGKGRIGIVGAGTIGFGWSHAFARAGFSVSVYHPKRSRLDDFERLLNASLDRPAEFGLTGDAEKVRRDAGRISVHSDLEVAVVDAIHVQEAVTEDLAVKQEVFGSLDAFCPANVVLASSTATLPMTDIAARTRRPERCVVIHPTNPPHVVPLVEIVPGERTSRETTERSLRLMRRVGQDPIVCRKEIFGFVLNRLQFALGREAFFLAREGIASVEDIEKVVSQGLGLRWAFLGPFGVETTNSPGIEVALSGAHVRTLRALMSDVCKPYDGPTEDESRLVVQDVRKMYPDHGKLTAYRDRMVVALRALKAEQPMPDWDRLSGL